jgi:hypothetical protein
MQLEAATALRRLHEDLACGICAGPICTILSAAAVQVWARALKPGKFSVRVSREATFGTVERHDTIEASDAGHLEISIRLTKLAPASTYFVSICAMAIEKIVPTQVLLKGNSSFQTLCDPLDVAYPLTVRGVSMLALGEHRLCADDLHSELDSNSILCVLGDPFASTADGDVPQNKVRFIRTRSAPAHLLACRALRWSN